MRKITTALASVCLAAAFSNLSLAHGVLAVCTSNEELSYAASRDEPTRDAAQSAAISAYEQIYGRSRCTTPKRLVLFSDSCVALSAKPVENNWPRPQRNTWRENQDFWVGGGGSEQDARLAARAGCDAGGNASCDIETVVCDNVEAAASKPVSPPAATAPKTELPSSVASSPPLPAPIPTATPEPVPSTSLFTQYYSAITNDITTFVREYDLQTVALIAATAAVCLFVALQLYSLIRTGRRRFRDIISNAC